ncbi:gp13 [Escherichia phage phiEB49]|uniref:Gp13 n=1 Tax=Escherichia phage phiEB49 TaxID=1048207 RepID=F8UBS3_9CAUD|nr:gp13 [Escherichia phage phiEB49]AEI91213.1 gp13 [Escherichia phage phiEB49]
MKVKLNDVTFGTGLHDFFLTFLTIGKVYDVKKVDSDFYCIVYIEDDTGDVISIDLVDKEYLDWSIAQ